MIHTEISFSNRENQRILKMAADVDLAVGLSPVICHDIQRNAETQSQRMQQASRYMDFIVL